jgi:tetratricopeptide (TPR) repeat protein
MLAFAWAVTRFVTDRPLMLDTPTRGRERRGLNWLIAGAPVAEQLSDSHKQDSLIHNIGLIYDNLGEKQQALKYYDQSLVMSRNRGDKRGEATTLNNMASIYFQEGD